jgi:hypothetical protein
MDYRIALVSRYIQAKNLGMNIWTVLVVGEDTVWERGANRVS